MGETWLRRWLFRCSLALAAGLAAFIVIAPWLGAERAPGLCGKLIALFGHDPTLRQAGLASAAGLAVTACVFFQPTERPSRPPRRPPSDARDA